ncbi:MAG: GNAT family N-acetyltransferase [Geminicoccaceae bacterium]
MNIRPANDEDRTAIAAVHAASWQDAYRGILSDAYLEDRVTADRSRHWREIEMRPDDVVIVADDGGVIGFIAIWCRPDPYIDNLHVLPGLRSKGVGGKLMVAAAEELLRRGKSTAYLWVFEQNRRAVRFYESLGGVVVARVMQPTVGHDLPDLKVVWSDLSVIARQQEALERPPNRGS